MRSVSPGSGTITLVRHGETEWSRVGRHTGRADIALTPAGERAAAALRSALAVRDFDLSLISPLRRARDTARMAGVSGEIDEDLVEWDYGRWEGWTTTEIRDDLGRTDWTIWSDPIPPGDRPGEQPEEVGVRADRVLQRCRPVVSEGGRVLLVAHGHFLRILTARWLDLPAAAGIGFYLGPTSVSTLGRENGDPVILTWNC